MCFFIFFLLLRCVLSNLTARPSSAAFSAASRPSAGLSPSRRNVASQLTELLTAFIASVRARSLAVSASASGVVSGGLSSVAGAVLVVLGRGGAWVWVPRTSVDEASKRAEAGWESTSGRCWEKNWWRRRSGALRGGWDARTVGAAEHVVVDTAWSAGAVEGTGDGGVEGSSACWGSLLLLGVLASSRVGDFALLALAPGTTLGGLEELKNLPPGGFENRE